MKLSFFISSILCTFVISLSFVGADPQFGFPRNPPEITETPQLYSQEESSTKLRWLNGATMQIIWPTGSKDVIHLTESFRTFCEFSGIFENDIHAKASIIGCNINGEETIVNIELQNEPMKKFILKNGTTFEKDA